MESFNALCSLVFLYLIGASEGNFFSLPSNWKVINNSSLPSYSTVQGPFRAVTDGNGNAIFSENNRTGLGFINVNSSGKFVLSVVLGLDLGSVPAMEIWTANRNRMVAEGAMLKLGSNGDMVLEDSDGTVAWNISIGKSKGMLMAKSGNLQIYNTTNSSLVSAGSNLVWQSWDYPTDTLVPGQGLKRGQTLFSNSSATNTSAGPYKLVMEPGGLVLFYTNPTQEPYWFLGLPGLDYQGVLRPCFYNSSSAGSEAVYTGENLQVSFNGTIGNSSSSCANGTASQPMVPFYNESEHRFLKLDSDGDLRVYKVSQMPGQNNATNWGTDFGLDPSNKNCLLPRACGPYGICENGQCTCPGYGTVDQFKQIQSLDVTQGCYSNLEPSCNQTSANQHYMRVEAADYYPNDYLVPEANVSSVEECQALCTANCSCVAAFFRNSSASCYLADGPLSSLKSAPNQTYKAYLKVLNNTPRNRSSASTNSLSVGSIAGITVSSVAAALFICLIGILFIHHKRRSREKESEADEEENDPDEMEEEAFLKTLPGLPPRFTYHELKEATDNFSRKLGTGGFGSVYEGVLKDNTRVAVKKLDGPRQGYKEFRAEVATIGSISHINLVRLRGFCADSRQRLLVYELLENGSLEKKLFSRPHDDGSEYLTWEQRYNVAVGTARGLTYLHEQCREPIMHLDIKPQNILLDKNFSPKVSDFGMSKLLNDDMTQVVTAVRGTPGYLAPEWLRHSIATKKCDVYSFGMVLLELVSGRKNFEPYAADPRLCYFPAWAMLRALEGKYMDLVDKRLGDNSADTEGVTRMIKVAFWCIQDNPNKRPWMSVALKMLEGEWEVPDAPMWLLQRGPEFLEGYGYEPMQGRGGDHEEPDEASIVTGNNMGTGVSDESTSSTQLSGPR